MSFQIGRNDESNVEFIYGSATFFPPHHHYFSFVCHGSCKDVVVSTVSNAQFLPQFFRAEWEVARGYVCLRTSGSQRFQPLLAEFVDDSHLEAAAREARDGCRGRIEVGAGCELFQTKTRSHRFECSSFHD